MYYSVNYKSRRLILSSMIHKGVLIVIVVSSLILTVCSLTVSTETLSPLSVEAPSQIDESLPFFITVTSLGIPVVNVTVVFQDQINMTNTRGIAYLVAPRVSPHGNNTFPLTVSKEGYNETTLFVTVLNVPQLVLNAVQSYIRENTSFMVKITDDNGNIVENATVLFITNESLSDRSGNVTFTAPHVNKRMNVAINASKAGYLSSGIIVDIYPGLSEQNLVGFLLVIGVCLTIAMLVLIYGIERYLKHRRINKPR